MPRNNKNQSRRGFRSRRNISSRNEGRAGNLVMRAARSPPHPPSIVENPWVTRTIRLRVDKTGETPTTVFIHTADLFAADEENYGITTGPRFHRVRVFGARVWGPCTSSTDASEMFVNVWNLAYGNETPNTGLAFSDVSPQGGTSDQPHLGWRWGLVDQGVIMSTTTSNTYTLFTIAGESTNGHYTVDVDCSMC